MENITPALILLWEVKRAVERGLSVSVGIKNYLNLSSISTKNIFSNQVEQWWLSLNSADLEFNKNQLSATRKYLLEILEAGLKGHAILENLKLYEIELISSCEDEIQKHIATLPLLLMVPLMFLIFPSLMMLLLGPLLSGLHF